VADTADHYWLGATYNFQARWAVTAGNLLIGSGTAPGGAGIESGQYLAPGDLIEMEIEGIGRLRNRVGAR
jgi:2-keto-4-pentenoate hydratase/2-oxohepta-3-ene-1,7-dioic acid hydratase in catechol pathway